LCSASIAVVTAAVESTAQMICGTGGAWNRSGKQSMWLEGACVAGPRVCQETHAVLWIALVQLDMPRQVNAGTACVAVMQVVKAAAQLTRYS
jgi:hypothetical protein